MNCEICGTEIKGLPYKTKIDNSVMITCKECSKYGKVQHQPQKQRNNRNKKHNNNHYRSRRPQKSYNKRSEDEFELVDNYQKIIRQAREKKNLTQKKLGEKIYERESVIAHIETGKMVPTPQLARKIEKILNIKIIEKIESDEREYQDVRRFHEATIGDIARIKRN